MKKRTYEIFNSLFERYPLLNDQKENIEKAFDILFATYQNGGKVLCCGNGGSAADSEHIVGELMKSFKMKRAIDKKVADALSKSESGKEIIAKLEGALPAVSLVSQSSLITAFANDREWESTFAQQVYGLGQEGDCLICLSTSGNSKNCVCATHVATAKGMSSVAFTGASGGALGKISTVTVSVNETETYKVQELHLPVYHCLCAMLESEFFE